MGCSVSVDGKTRGGEDEESKRVPSGAVISTARRSEPGYESSTSDELSVCRSPLLPPVFTSMVSASTWFVAQTHAPETCW